MTPRAREPRVDAAQWRVLLKTYLVMDLRAGSGAVGPEHRRRRLSGGLPYAGLLLLTTISGAAMSVLIARIQDLQAGAMFLTTYGALNAAMLLLVDFTSVVVSPTDYAVLGHRPVSSQTYFAARLASVLVYISLLALAFGILPAFTYWFWRGLGFAAFGGALLAVLLCNLTVTVLVITIYVFLLNVVHPQRLTRAMSSLQLVSATLFYGAFALAMSPLRGALVEDISFAAMPWLWANPGSWFAAIVPVSTGEASEAQWLGAAAAVALGVACAPLAAGRLSLDYARRLGEVSAAGTPGRTVRRSRFAFPGFRRNEARAVALLVRAQFRFDNRFRLSVLGIVPLILFYLVLGLDQGALTDPMSEDSRVGGGALVYMAVVFMPMTLHASLHLSESWRAAWIFFATPASAARLVLAAKNFSAVFFLGGYLVLLAGIWSVFYERAWHAVAHAFVIGLLAHVLLQLAVLVQPVLPFSTEPRRAEQSSRVFAVFFVGGSAAAVLSVLLPLVYRRPAAAVALVSALIAATVALELLLHRAVNRAIGELEFRS